MLSQYRGQQRSLGLRRRGLSIVKCTFAIDHDKGVVDAIQSIDAIKRRSQDLDGRNLPRPVERDDVSGRQREDVVGQSDFP